MPKPKSGTKKKKAAGRAPARIENPSWLREDPTGAAPNPPVRPRTDVLPFTSLTWEDFERLCVRLAERGANVEAAWAYGKTGHAQHGIDVLVRLPDGTYHVWQSKRHTSISKAKIDAAVQYFLRRKWAQRATRFVLAVACEFSSPAVIDAIEAARDKLRARNIDFEALDASHLTQQLKDEPIVVDDFFKRQWVEAICLPEAVEQLRQRLSRFDAADLKNGLQSCYNSWISTVDPGLPIVGVDAQGRTRATTPLPKRYVRPDLLIQSSETGDTAPPERDLAANRQPSRNAESGSREPDHRASDVRPPRAFLRERRMELDEYLGSHTRSLVLGDAGSGKSTLLRFLALDILSSEPVLKVTQERFRTLIPVWLPFALWVRMSADRHAPAPLEDVAAEYVHAQGGPELAENMRRAVLGKRIVLLVDGIDEAANPAVAQTLLAVLTTLIDQTGISVVATSRPHGARSLNGLGDAWERATLAPLSDDQRHALANLWFGLLERFEADNATDAQIRTRSRQKANAFVSALQGNVGINRLSQTPLFLLAFINLHSRGQDLPRNRFAASKEIVDQLMEHQPNRRAVSALSTDPSQAEPRLRNRIISDFAFALQAGDLRGAIPDAADEDDAVARGARLILHRQNSGNQDAAEASARAIFSFTEERAGLLVNKAPGNIGFLHLSLQEYLAARHLMQLSADDKIAFVSVNAGTLRWREPILYLLAMTPNEADTGQLIEAIEKAQPKDVAEQAARDTLLADAVFADFSHDLGVVRRVAKECLAEAESTAWGERQRHLLTAAVDGLFSESVRSLCQTKLAEWVPDRHGYARGAAIDAIGGWDVSSRTAAIPALLRCLRSENEHIWRKAAQVLPLIAERRVDVKDQLLRLARTAPSVQTAQAALFSVGFGWTQDEDVGEIARRLRASSHDGLSLDAIRIRAHRGETDAEDLDCFYAIAYGRERYSDSLFAHDLAEYFALHHRDAFAKKLESSIAAQLGDGPFRMKPLVGALLLCDSNNASARRELSQLLDRDWMLADLFTRGNFPVDRVTWTPDLVAKIETQIADKKRYGDHDLYWIAKTLRLPYLKQRFLDGLRQGEHLGFWYSRGLAEIWGRDDPEVQDLFASMLDADPKHLSDVAEELPLIIDDRAACRATLLRGMHADVPRYDFLLKGCKNLGVTAEDEEMVQAALAAGERKRAPLYRDMWCANIIATFPAHPRVRIIAEDELLRRDGSLGAVAFGYPNDPDMCHRVLNVLCPLDQSARMTLIRALETAAPANAVAHELLLNGRQDTDGLVCAESIMGGIEATIARGPLPEQDLRWLVDELDTVGPEYEKRRTAAVIGLLLTGNIDHFVSAKEHSGKPLDVAINPDLAKEDIYLRRLLPRWPELSQALGGDAEILSRFEITPERTLKSLHAGTPQADRLFGLLMDKVPSAQHLHKKDLITALAEFAPQGQSMRELLETMLRDSLHGRTIGDITAMLHGGQIFADYFHDDRALRALAIDAFNAYPGNAMATGALVEILLRENDRALADSVFERVRDRQYDTGTNLKLMAAFSSSEGVIETLTDFLAEDIEQQSWAIPYWVPALVRRIKADPTLQTHMRAALAQASVASIKVTFAALLGRGMGSADDLRQYAIEELDRLNKDPIPVIGYDLTTNSHRLLFQVLTELTL
ncbi:NACHT domain-containing protein [Bradyrhizobium sp. AZCC 2289]|uniref:NACHT domain-containing protein n=1 Tax=Bradyrhizobium sp. AZCC 2289 TaxID=3117026 RepID=UPI002FF1875F